MPPCSLSLSFFLSLSLSYTLSFSLSIFPTNTLSYFISLFLTCFYISHSLSFSLVSVFLTLNLTFFLSFSLVLSFVFVSIFLTYKYLSYFISLLSLRHTQSLFLFLILPISPLLLYFSLSRPAPFYSLIFFHRFLSSTYVYRFIPPYPFNLIPAIKLSLFHTLFDKNLIILTTNLFHFLFSASLTLCVTSFSTFIRRSLAKLEYFAQLISFNDRIIQSSYLYPFC